MNFDGKQLPRRNGWKNQKRALEWFLHFETHMRARANGRTRVQIVNGHISHIGVQMTKTADEHGIGFFKFPKMRRTCSSLWISVIL